MKSQWLNLVLLFTNRIYNRKQSIIAQTGLKAAGNILVLIWLEIILAIVSFPLYVGVKPQKVTAFFAERGAYSKINFDYSLRRIVTITGLSVVFAIWAVKLILILSVPKVYGPLHLFNVSPLQPVDILTAGTANTDAAIQSAKVVNSLPPPQLTQVKKAKNKDFTFFGTGLPGETVVLILSNGQSAIYYGTVSAKGNWQISHSQNAFKLSPGNHSVMQFSYYSKTGARSNFSDLKFFKVQTTFLDKLVNNVDVLANWTVVLIIVLGIFLTFLTI